MERSSLRGKLTKLPVGLDMNPNESSGITCTTKINMPCGRTAWDKVESRNKELEFRSAKLTVWRTDQVGPGSEGRTGKVQVQQSSGLELDSKNS